MDQFKNNSANSQNEAYNNQSVDNCRLHELELKLEFEKHTNAELSKENAEMKKKIERLATENRMLHREVGKKEGIQEILERNFANADQRAQQLEREVGQLLGELSHEQSKVEEVRLELNAVSQQNAELCAELEQFRIQADASELNDIKDEDENMAIQSPTGSQNFVFFAAENELENEEEDEPKVLDDVQTSQYPKNYMEFEMEMENVVGDQDFTQSSTQADIPRTKRQDYVEIARFENSQLWREWMSEPEQELWRRISRGQTQTNKSKSSVHICQYFYCKHSRRHHPESNCLSLLKVAIHKETDEVTVFQSLAHGDHIQKGGLTLLAKEIMREKIRQHKSVAQIHDFLVREHNVSITKKQIVNFIQRERRKRELNMNIAAHSLQTPKSILMNNPS